MGRVTQLKETGLQSDLPDAESRGCMTSCLIQSLSRVSDTWPSPAMTSWKPGGIPSAWMVGLKIMACWEISNQLIRVVRPT